ncbi:histone-lysine N-methyltransferase: setb1-like protein [Dinothrombium tinctorium]|uniref:Histone-lysine N-methyltransferase: setb1-like protein n=1 Tax=Dinothrombium tinctorium TaxID=1965070 RepID=A0A3S4RDF1_9ACAR|nr:histone-lysine N-methyltransferase: setb1-like protein [Dinothrombium tinctorium]RWS14798.1 histone-lysine N-methyltransferase: setb1-like protein [Dinothrombium tinctorium]RWS14799.1 histone-lysine N-methyltransferase: setb1-like protein [Dinothrombium tinctorium]
MIILTKDSFLRVKGPFQRIVPIDKHTKRAARERSYVTDEDYVLTGSTSGFANDDDYDDERAESPDLVELQFTQSDQSSLPPEPIVRKVLELNDDVYAFAGKGLSNQWRRATITELFANEKRYRISFVDNTLPDCILPSTKLAYTSNPSGFLHCGLRVIAYFKKEPSLPSFECPLLSGMVAETPKPSNNNRYLIFFDDGGVSYVLFEEIYVIVQDSIPWEEITNERYKRFIKKYCEEFPERAMIKFQKGEKIKVKVKKEWLYGTVKEIDSSLVKIYYEKLDETEWLYRGSVRLFPFYSKFSETQRESLNTSSKPRRNRISKKSVTTTGQSQPFIQYTTEESEIKSGLITNHVTKVQTAKKSTSRNQVFTDAMRLAKRANVEMKPRILLVETPELYEKNKTLKNIYYEHDCSNMCIRGINESLQSYRNCNPYSIPVMCRWQRELKVNTRRNKEVFYVTPCGLEIYDIEDIEKYLLITRSRLPIDLFTFEPIELYGDDKRKMRSYYYDKDLSKGLEFQAISVVNSVDHEKPAKFKYRANRIAASNVTIPLDENFLSCCNCTDNCRNKNNCSCQQLTCDIAKYECGYEKRRLCEIVQTGIFECNSKCPCNSKCANKVVQLGIRVQLQLFKTPKKGWGVRVLHDVPKGAFICTYSAEIINDTSTPEDDTYFADLDYIDACESFKEGYESSVEISSESESEYEEKSDEEENVRPQKRIKLTKEKNKKEEKKAEKQEFFEIRKYYNEDFSYTLDAQKIGNIGRFLNHSCDPNCFVQNVFVDTQDPRFPWVAIFAMKNISAFEEITWDYNYEVGSIENRKLYCHCGSSNCRGRLL